MKVCVGELYSNVVDGEYEVLIDTDTDKYYENNIPDGFSTYLKNVYEISIDK